MKKTLIVAMTLSALTGTAMADDPPAGGDAGGGGDASGGGGDATGGGDAAAPAPTGGDATGGDMAAAAKTKSIGVDVVGVLPLSDYGDAADFGIGALARFEYGLKPNIAITARAGLIYNLAKDPISTFLLIPVHVGGKYSIGTSGLFVQGELGITHARVSIDIAGATADDNNTKFSFEAGAGYQKGKLSARAGFYYVATDNALQGIMASVGYDFAAL
jgi:hypothetical protein